MQTFTMTTAVVTLAGALFGARHVPAQGPRYELKLEAPAAAAPESEVPVTLRGTSAQDLVAYSAVITYDLAVLALLDAGFGGTAWGDADFASADGASVPGQITVAAVMDIDGTGPAQVAAGDGLAFLRLTFKAGAAEGRTVVGFFLDVDANLLADAGLSGHDATNGLALTPAEVEIAREEGVFVRGDCNHDRGLDISDAIYTLTYLFLGSEDPASRDPACKDACDSNDDGDIDIADPVWSLNYLFRGSPPPPQPYPDPGTDPTPADRLDCEVGLS
ncbi:MAG: hypothetical protein HY721_32895 [Planctomycetes bacterium]|nr:hypothetical protein [Planctomycetota bacterium]